MKQPRWPVPTRQQARVFTICIAAPLLLWLLLDLLKTLALVLLAVGAVAAWRLLRPTGLPPRR